MTLQRGVYERGNLALLIEADFIRKLNKHMQAEVWELSLKRLADLPLASCGVAHAPTPRFLPACLRERGEKRSGHDARSLEVGRLGH